MEDEGGEEPPAPGTEEDAPLKSLLRPAASSTPVSHGDVGSHSFGQTWGPHIAWCSRPRSLPGCR